VKVGQGQSFAKPGIDVLGVELKSLDESGEGFAVLFRVQKGDDFAVQCSFMFGIYL